MKKQTESKKSPSVPNLVEVVNGLADFMTRTNSIIDILNNKVYNMQIDIDKLKKKYKDNGILHP